MRVILSNVQREDRQFVSLVIVMWELEVVEGFSSISHFGQ